MTDRAKLIEELREFFTYIDEDRQDIITKAIAALSVPAKPEPIRCDHCGDLLAMTTLPCESCKPEPTKAERFATLIAERDALLAEDEEASRKQAQIKTLTFLQTYTTIAEAEAWQSKIPAPTIILHLWSRGGKDLFAVAGNDDVQMLVSALKPAESEPLPESVEGWLAHNHRFERDASITKYIKVFDYARVEYYLQQREAVHQSELAKAKEEGRREALQGVPVLVLSEVSGFLSGIESLTQKENKPYAAAVRAQVDAIRKLIESARAAQI